MPEGRLTIVGTGYMGAGQVTPQALSCMQKAEKLLFLTPHGLTFAWLQKLSPSAESLHDAYAVGKPRMDTYFEMVARMLAPVRQGLDVCTAFYGHPGVLVFPAHEAIRQARAEGYPARMLPGVSAADCLFAELGVDPGVAGCQMYDATEFLYRQRRFDPACPLILWQLGFIAFDSVPAVPGEQGSAGMRVLAEVLLRDYPPDHEVVVYETASLPVCRSRISRLPLGELAEAYVTGVSTLYVPPWGEIEYDYEIVQRLTPPDSDTVETSTQ